MRMMVRVVATTMKVVVIVMTMMPMIILKEKKNRVNSLCILNTLGYVYIKKKHMG